MANPMFSCGWKSLLMVAALSCAVFADDAKLPADDAKLPADEKAPPAHADCFPGAIYRKAVSSVDLWTGIDVVVTLPTFTPDPARVDPKSKRPLDNPSCYIGGRAGETEIDAGVSFEVIKEPDGSVSTQRKAFRPFWRNKTWTTGPAKDDLYFYPGDTIHMKCWTESAGKLKFRVELLSRAGQPAPAEPIASHDVEFDAPSFGPGKAQQFKRVSAIDQVHNEGKATQATATRVEGTVWQHADLLRGEEKRPFIAARFTDMRCPSADVVKVSPGDEAVGGEKVDLIGR